MNIKRLAFSTILIAALAASLTGCFKMTTALVVDKQDQVSGSAIVAVSKQLMAFGNQSGSGSSFDQEKLKNYYKKVKGVTVTSYSDSNFVGAKYSFKSVPLKKFGTSKSDTTQLSISRKGDYLVTSGFFDMRGDGTTDMSNPFIKPLMASMDISFSVTFPGKVVSTNGTLKKTTVTWSPIYGQKTMFKAKAYAPLPKPMNWLYFGLGSVLVLLLVALLLLMAAKKRKKQVSDEYVVDPEASNTDGSI